MPCTQFVVCASGACVRLFLLHSFCVFLNVNVIMMLGMGAHTVTNKRNASTTASATVPFFYHKSVAEHLRYSSPGNWVVHSCSVSSQHWFFVSFLLLVFSDIGYWNLKINSIIRRTVSCLGFVVSCWFCLSTRLCFPSSSLYFPYELSPFEFRFTQTFVVVFATVVVAAVINFSCWSITKCLNTMRQNAYWMIWRSKWLKHEHYCTTDAIYLLCSVLLLADSVYRCVYLYVICVRACIA